MIVSRKLEMKIPVKTEFKLELADISKNDIDIKNNVLTFKNPLTAKKWIHKEGELEILKLLLELLIKQLMLLLRIKKQWNFWIRKAKLLSMKRVMTL